MYIYIYVSIYVYTYTHKKLWFEQNVEKRSRIIRRIKTSLDKTFLARSVIIVNVH